MLIRRLYQALLGILGFTLFVGGLAFTAAFVLYQRPFSDPAIPTGPVGYYFVAFTGAAMMGWGGGLMGAARAPEASRTITTITSWVLVVMAAARMIAWSVGDYTLWLGDLPRHEATAFLFVALALVWLRPRSGTARGDADSAAAADVALEDAA